MKNYFETTDRNRYLIFETESDEHTDSVAEGMLDNNNIAGLLPFTHTRADNISLIKYDVTSFMTLSELLEGCIKRESVISVIDEILETYTDIENYLIAPDSLILDSEKIFYSRDDGHIHMILNPVINTGTLNMPLNIFLKNLICRIKFDSTENCDYIGKMLGYLNSSREFSAEDFRYIVNEQKASSDKTAEDRHQAVTDDEKIPSMECSEHTTEEKEPVFVLKKPQTDRDNEPENSFRLPLDFYADDENSDESRNRKSIFSKIFGESRVKNKTRKKESDDDSVLVQYCDKNGNVSREESYENETVLLGSQIKPESSSFLLRIRNNEKIFLRKNSFRIGTEKKSVDYCINDNCAVSRFHAEIIHRNNSFFIVDNNSTNHTFLNEHEIKSRYEMKLQNKSRIKLADEEFIFYI